MSTASNDVVESPSTDVEAGETRPPPSNKFEFTWQDLKVTSEHINDGTWTRRQLPAIIKNFPQDALVNETISSILRWSVLRPEEFKDDVLSHTSEQQQDDSSTDDRDALLSTKPQVDDIVVPTEPTTSNNSDGEASTVSSSINLPTTNPLLFRLKQIRHDVATKIAQKAQNIILSAPVASTIPIEAPALGGECISCYDEFSKPDLIRAKCCHDYCKPCLREVVLNAMKTETAFPPKCCLTEIPLKLVLACLDSEQRDEYKEKSAEYSIPAGHRWYCPESKCGKWIKPEKLHRNRRDLQMCPHCKTKICSICRSLAHDQNQDCPQDFGLEATLEVAESEGWQRCYSCRAMVELTTGCRHMRCRCGAEFCYVCCAQWRTCGCTEADKDRRLQEVRARREQRDEQQREEDQRREEEDETARAEAEELAEAIRQVEEMERQDAIRRVEEERQRQLEEELMLARLEEARLLEEIARREAEEEAERQLREVLLTSSKEECQAMMKTLMQIINLQHTSLMSSHATLEHSCVQESSMLSDQLTQQNEQMSTWLEENIAKRMETLSDRQRREWEQLLHQAEEEEDEMFMQVALFLRGKPNREQREKKMRETFQREQLEKQTKTQTRYDQERQQLEIGAYYEREGLQKAANARLEPVAPKLRSSLQRLGRQIGCDRRWFQLICTRRLEMMKEHRRLVIEQLEAEQEPIGLTEAQARLIEPQIPAVDAEQPENSETPPKLAITVPTTSNQASSRPLSERPISEVSSGPAIHSNSPVSAVVKPTSSGQHLVFLPTANCQLSRSETVIRHVPGAFPATSDGPNRNTFPPAAQRGRRYHHAGPQLADKTHSCIDGSISMPSSTTPLFTNGLQNDHVQSSETTIAPSSPQLNASQPSESPTMLSTVSSTSTAETNATTDTSASISTSFTSLEPDADLLDSICASKITRDMSEASTRKTRSFFKGFRKSSKELSEQEIKRRMSLCVGDGMGV